MAIVVLVVADATSLGTGDTNLQTRLQNAGHTVILRSDDDAEYGGTYDGVLISDSCAAATIGTKYATVDKSVILLENGPWSGYGMVGATSSETGTQWDVQGTSPLTAGLSGTRTIFTTSQTTNAAVVSGLGSGAIVAAVWTSDTTSTSYFAYDTGAQMTTGLAPARRVGLRYPNTAMGGQIDTDGLALLDAAIAWSFSTPSGETYRTHSQARRRAATI